MKKILTLLVCTMFLFSACNKNKKLNKSLNGTWVSTMQDGQPIPADEATKITFSKDGKDDGSVTIIGYEDGQQTSQGTGTYIISDKGETLTIDANGTTTASGATPSFAFTYRSVGKISDQSDSKFTYNAATTITSGGLGASDNSIIVFTKQ